MIKKIIHIRDVGLLKNSSAMLHATTVIYAENGRGKSTLAAILQSCARGDAGRVYARRTIDSKDEPAILFLNEKGAAREFKNGSWSGPVPSMVIFDSDFVEENVYSGAEVRAEQRQHLLEFALGDLTIDLKQKVDDLTREIENWTKQKAALEKELTSHAGPNTIEQFINLTPFPDAEKRIDSLNKKVEATRKAAQLLKRDDPRKLPSFDFDLKEIYEILGDSLNQVLDRADEIVEEHLSKHKSAELEDWLSRGQTYIQKSAENELAGEVDENCPFCGQSLEGLALIKAYRTYFNSHYQVLKSRVSELGKKLDSGLSSSKIETLAASVETNAARIDAWKDQLEIVAPNFDKEKLGSALHETRKHLFALVSEKQLAPLDPVGSEKDREACQLLIAAMNQTIAQYNFSLEEILSQIEKLKKEVISEDVEIRNIEISYMKAHLERQNPVVIKLIADYTSADKEKARLEDEKNRTRDEIDRLMGDILNKYQGTINELLKDMHASFSIEQLKPSYIGGGQARTEYGLLIRSKQVRLGSRSDSTSTHCFATALSEGDKRTLAFAFFLARLSHDKHLADRVIVLDDPVSSLDKNRRRHTLERITNLATKCRQLIVLSHDEFFLRDFCENLENAKKPIPHSILMIKRVQNGYSDFATCDINDVCCSAYYRNHKIICDFIDAKSTLALPEVVKAIRPLLEGYLHRRFPGQIRRNCTFGQIISDAESAPINSPLSNLAHLVEELRKINEYTSPFHHGGKQPPLTDTELMSVAQRALKIVYSGK